MKLSLKDRKTVIQLVLAATVIGALLYRDYRIAGLTVTLAAIGFYLIFNTRTAVPLVRRFRRTSNVERLKLTAYAALLYIFISGIVTHTIYYFLLLLILAIDYFLSDNPSAKNEDTH